MSDWDLAVYYRGRLDYSPLAAFGEVHAPGSWGRIMNGGAWLRHGGVGIDVLFRDLDMVEHWTAQADRGRMRAWRGDVTATLGLLGRATTEAAHAVMCGRREWVLNEKGLIDRAGLALVHQHVAPVASNGDGLISCVEQVGVLLRVSSPD